MSGITDPTVAGCVLELEAAQRMGAWMVRATVRRLLEWAFEEGRRSVLGGPIHGNDEDDEKPRG